MKIRFCTTNPGKLAEAQARLGPLGYSVEGARPEAPEIQADMLEAVARAKAQSLIGSLEPPFFCEDAGLFIDALKGFPGVYSHPAFKTIGNEGILRLLMTESRRTATFRAVIALVEADHAIRLFLGEAPGLIARSPRGTNGFGFDPIFEPIGSTRTFAQFDAAEKGQVSHRGRALDQLAKHLAQANKKV
jgi:XTP/dITP diphosphohydrolase